MKKNITEIVFILDRSGSMHGMEKDTVGGFNSVIEQQKQLDGTILVSTVLFNGRASVLHDRVPIEKIEPMTEKDFKVSGSTALLDALGGAIRHIGNIHKYARKEDVPDHTLFVIMTDGMENASRMYTSDEVKKMITHEKEKYHWEFMFLASNIDAVETSRRYGIDDEMSIDYHNDTMGSAVSYRTIARAAMDLHCTGKIQRNFREEADADFNSRR